MSSHVVHRMQDVTIWQSLAGEHGLCSELDCRISSRCSQETPPMHSNTHTHRKREGEQGNRDKQESHTMGRDSTPPPSGRHRTSDQACPETPGKNPEGGRHPGHCDEVSRSAPQGHTPPSPRDTGSPSHGGEHPKYG